VSLFGFKVRSNSYEGALGFLLAMPFSWPSPPFYWCSFVVFLFAIINNTGGRFDPARSATAFLVCFLIILALFSNLYSLNGRFDIDSFRVFSSSLFFGFFLFGGMLKDGRGLLYGFIQGMLLWAILVVFLAFYTNIFNYGLLLFSVPNYRLWGEEYFPDWPNYFAFMLALAFLLNSLLFKRPFVSIVLLSAAMLTTSRTPVLAFGLFMFYTVIVKGIYGIYMERVLSVVSILLILISIVILVPSGGEFMDRLTVIEDRVEIYSFALEMTHDALLLGNGSILLDKSVGFGGHASFHNTYLDILVRHGLFALIAFLILIIPGYKKMSIGGVGFMVVIFFFIIGSLFQNFLKHPHVVMLFMTIMHSSKIFNK